MISRGTPLCDVVLPLSFHINTLLCLRRSCRISLSRITVKEMSRLPPIPLTVIVQMTSLSTSLRIAMFISFAESILFQRHAVVFVTSNALCITSGLLSDSRGPLSFGPKQYCLAVLVLIKLNKSKLCTTTEFRVSADSAKCFLKKHAYVSNHTGASAK